MPSAHSESHRFFIDGNWLTQEEALHVVYSLQIPELTLQELLRIPSEFTVFIETEELEATMESPDPKLLQYLRKDSRLRVEEKHVLGKLHSASVFRTGVRSGKTYQMEERCRRRLIADGYFFDYASAASVLKFFPGGQFGSNRGMINAVVLDSDICLTANVPLSPESQELLGVSSMEQLHRKIIRRFLTSRFGESWGTQKDRIYMRLLMMPVSEIADELTLCIQEVMAPVWKDVPMKIDTAGIAVCSKVEGDQRMQQVYISSGKVLMGSDQNQVQFDSQEPIRIATLEGRHVSIERSEAGSHTAAYVSVLLHDIFNAHPNETLTEAIV